MAGVRAFIGGKQGGIVDFRRALAKLTLMSTPEPEEPHSAPTLSAVARLAGVSAITVSRVVRLPNLVAPETRGRVETAMPGLGDLPNQLARAPASARPPPGGRLAPAIANSL